KQFWGTSTGADRYRRGMYIYLWRSSPYPFLKTFDMPDAVVACTRRARSNTPLQALTLANEQASLEVARGFARRLLDERAVGDRDRTLRACRQALARTPTDGELVRLLQYLESQRTQFAADAEAAAQLAPE